VAYKLKPQQRQRMSTLQRGTLIIATGSLIGLSVYFAFFSQIATNTETVASELMISNDTGNDGEVITHFDWNSGEPLQPTFGMTATQLGKGTDCSSDGVNQTPGLSAGREKNAIRLELPVQSAFNSDGIDISIDFRRLEPSGSFVTRGKDFDFGIKNGKLSIRYKVISPAGKQTSVEKTTDYEIPKDLDFRNYRFVYKPASGRAEILVDDIPVWSHQTQAFDKLKWQETEGILIGNEMEGDGSGKCIFDNLVIRQNGSTMNIPIELLSFTAEPEGNKIMLNWFTGKETDTEYFIIEKSSNTQTFEQIGKVKAAGKSQNLKAYALLDTKPSEGVNYYRLALSNHRSKSIWIPVIAIRYQQDKPAEQSPPQSWK
jgi:hypothetical protein